MRKRIPERSCSKSEIERNISASERAHELLKFFKADTLAASNVERDQLSLCPVASFTYAIEGLQDCYKSEVLLTEEFRKGADSAILQRLVSEAGSSCVVTSDEAVALEYLRRCCEFGNTDVSLYDIHRSDAVLLYVTWTNA